MSQNAANAKVISRKLHYRSLFFVSGQQAEENHGFKVNPFIEIFQASFGDESVYYPAQHLSINTADEIKALRDFLTEILNEQQPEAA